MPTSITSDYHFMAKLAKNRMIKEAKSVNTYKNRNNQVKDVDFYYNVVKILLSTETVYNPISRLVGKDLEHIPNSCEKQRAVFQVINKYTEIRTLLKKDLLNAIRENRNFEIRDISVNPVEMLSKLQ
ncbi:MAG: hypothetical protein K2I78_02495 [Clostridia bacterium]|nr:hypothetical protein [Clostridia bacterium]MDE7215195.1 hypothetical protein [Clostridia bacterium]